jgi:hypothetical protein
MGGGLKLPYALLLFASATAQADSYYMTVAGLGGEPDYEQRFKQLASDLDRVFKGAHAFTVSGPEATRAHVVSTLQTIAAQAKPADDFVLVLIGHGSYDGVDYKLNLPGPDITAVELARLCDHIQAKRQLVINTTSASGGSQQAFEKKGRAVITATKSGTEKNATVFARYFVEGLQDAKADTDKNEIITAAEAFQYAKNKTAAFYDSQKRLATEHPMLLGEGRLALVRFGTTTGPASPANAALLGKKEALEKRIDTLKLQRAAMSPQDYRQQLTELLLALAKIQRELDK